MSSLKIYLILITCFSIVFFKTSVANAPVFISYFVVWNVGQGQWLTQISPDKCQHFDVGGEIKTFNRIKPYFISLCSQKLNEIFLTHWDYDHVLNLPQLVRYSAKTCWQIKPLIGVQKKMSQKILSLNIPSCANKSDIEQIWHPQNFKNTNDASIVFGHKNILISGDSPMSQEKIWSTQMNLQSTKVLILGHHGSKTSTSEQLLEKLPHLKMSLVSTKKIQSTCFENGGLGKYLAAKLLKN
jgi:competence protein ComEC